MSEEDFLLALRLQQEELEDARNKTFGKCGVNSDPCIALEMMFEFSNIAFIEYSDEKIAKSFERAISSDQDLINALENCRIQEETDKEYATSLAGLKDSDIASSSKLKESSIASSSKLNGMNSSPEYAKIPTGLKDSPIASSSQFNGKVSISKVPMKCESCYLYLEDDENLCRLDCKHFYCLECLAQLCRYSLRDRSLIPIRCCKVPINEDLIVKALDDVEYGRYLSFMEDQKGYSDLILDEEFAETVRSLGWKICSNCKRGVEKKDGCNHMTCLCKHQFCYLCGADWEPRTCKCELFAASEIEQIIDNVAPRANEANREALRQIYRHHDQHVHSWTRKNIDCFNRRYRKCTGCSWVCNQWYHQCDTCLQIYCTRCVRNRD